MNIPLARVTEVTADRRIILDDRWMPPAGEGTMTKQL
jgi:predicted component of type VI protein secretion system